MTLFILLNLCLFSYTCMNSFGKVVLLSGTTVTEFSLFRSAFLTLISYLMIKTKPGLSLGDVPKSNRKMLAFRSFIGTVTFFVITIPVGLIPLSVMQSVLSTVPFWIAAIQMLFFGEKVVWYLWLAMIVAYIGIVIVSTSAPDDS